MTAATDRWRDSATGASEEVAFVGEPGRRLFTVTNRPADEPRGCLIVCSPILIEQMRNYRREVVLARDLASRGFQVIRFHYRGSGHSDGDNESLLLQTMADDVRQVAALAGGTRAAFLGTRLGAVAAASAADPSQPLVLWEPTTSPRRYFREVFRAKAVGDLKQEDEQQTAPSPKEELAELGATEVLGFKVTAALVDSFAGAGLDELLTGRRARSLIIETTSREPTADEPGSEPNPDDDPLVDRAVVVDKAAAWWFPAALSNQERGGDEALIRLTADWLASNLDNAPSEMAG